MQFLFVRHALPQRSEPGQGSDPDLSELGFEQARRLPAALARFPIARVISSPQRRAMQTAQPVAEALGMPVQVDERFAEYDRGLSHYVPIEEVAKENPQQLQRLIGGELPDGVDPQEFQARIAEAVEDVLATSNHSDTVAVFSHGGVINVILHRILRTERMMSFYVDYASMTRVLASRTGRLAVGGVNTIEHVWDLLPRNRGV
ncbi:histidine phosphatase family protein [Mycolicibacterium thermoresistibile]